MKHVRVNNANIEPVFFAYPDNEKLDVIIKKYTANKPVYDFIAPGMVLDILSGLSIKMRILLLLLPNLLRCRLFILPTDITVLPLLH